MELVLVITKTGMDIPEDEGLKYVLLYTASDDISARTLQVATKQWSFGNGLDNSYPIGRYKLVDKVFSAPIELARWAD